MTGYFPKLKYQIKVHRFQTIGEIKEKREMHRTVETGGRGALLPREVFSKGQIEIINK